jgi:hypothetical protein
MTSKARIRATQISSLGLVAGIAFGVALVTAGFAGAVPTPSQCPLNSNCTANDVEILVLAAAAVGDPTCTDTNDTVQIEVTTTLNPNASNRFDVGTYVPINVEGNECLADVLDAPQASGDIFDADGDDCPDMGGGDVTHVQTYTVPCEDANDNGLLDTILLCQSWTQNDDTIAACTESNVFEGTSAKCSCDQVNADIPIGAPAMSKYGYAALGLLLLSAGAIFVRKSNLI